jgi:internalin A
VVELGGAERYFAVTFPDSQQEQAVRQALGVREDSIQRWNLSEIRELSFCGNMVLRSTEGVRFDADGTCRVNGAPVIEGKVKDLRLFADMLRLERLALIRQPVTDLSALNGLTLLRELDLAGSGVTDLASLQELPSLEILRLEHTNLRDLTGLEDLPGLRTVTVSRDMLPLRWSDSAGFDVVLAGTADG